MKADSYELWQGGICVAKTSGPDNEARREISHYAMMYAADGPVTIYLRMPNGKKVEVTDL